MTSKFLLITAAAVAAATRALSLFPLNSKFDQFLQLIIIIIIDRVNSLHLSFSIVIIIIIENKTITVAKFNLFIYITSSHSYHTTRIRSVTPLINYN